MTLKTYKPTTKTTRHLIGIDRSELYMFSVLGVMSIGAVYVPLDDAHPDDRIQFILEDTAARVLIVSDGTVERAKELVDADVVLAKVFRDFAKGDFRIGPTSPAYNAGTLTGLTLLPSVDLAGSARVMFDKIDIGCYESQNRPGFVMVMR